MTQLAAPTPRGAQLLTDVMAHLRGEAPFRYSMRWTQRPVLPEDERAPIADRFPRRDAQDQWLHAEREGPGRVRIHVVKTAAMGSPDQERTPFWVVAHDGDAFYIRDGDFFGMLSPTQAPYACSLPSL